MMNANRGAFLGTVVLFAGCAAAGPAEDRAPAPIPAVGEHEEAAVFAGGCFWCMESDFDKLPGVVATTSGYAGGTEPNPTYEQVSSQTTDYRESVRVVFDTDRTSYAKVLEWYWHHVDPTDAGGQFCDRGPSYRTAVFYADEAQRKAARASKAAIERSGVLPGPVVTPILPLGTFYAAENYHQDYYQKHPARYHAYRVGCGRDARVAQVWAKAR